MMVTAEAQTSLIVTAVKAGVNDYIGRMPHECSVKITTVATTKRTKNISVIQAQQREQDLLLKVSSNNSYRIALDKHGVSWSTSKLSANLKSWLQNTPVVNLYIGGPDGFTKDFLDQLNRNKREIEDGIATLPAQKPFTENCTHEDYNIQPMLIVPVKSD